MHHMCVYWHERVCEARRSDNNNYAHVLKEDSIQYVLIQKERMQISAL